MHHTASQGDKEAKVQSQRVKVKLMPSPPRGSYCFKMDTKIAGPSTSHAYNMASPPLHKLFMVYFAYLLPNLRFGDRNKTTKYSQLPCKMQTTLSFSLGFLKFL